MGQALAALQGDGTQLGPYLAVLVWIWLASIGVPIPEDIALLGGGFACYYGNAKLAIMIPLSMFAVLSGDIFVFYLGRRWASGLLEHRYVRWLASPARIEALRKQFLEHQLKTVFAGRFLPGMRALIFLTAGAMKMKFWRFLAANGSAALISVPTLVLLGAFFGKSFEELKKRVQIGGWVIAGAIILFVSACYLWRRMRSHRKTRFARLETAAGQTVAPIHAVHSDSAASPPRIPAKVTTGRSE